jgi:tape measure domain-containing protein
VADSQIRITADTAQAQAAIRGLTDRLSSIEGAVNKANRSLQGMQSALGGIVSALAGSSLVSFIDELQNMQNKLRVATGSQEDFNMAMSNIRAIADKTGQSISATGDLYASVAKNADKMGYSQAQVTTVTNAMATALKVSGASAQGSASVMYQFSQILAKGVVNGDEFTTIMENLGGPVMDLVAKNMGVTTAELIKLKEKGLIGAKDFTDALIRSMSDLDKMSGKASQTIGQSMQRIQNAFATAVLAIDNASGFGATFANIANKIASNGENLIPVIKVIGVALGALAIYFAPVISLFAAAAAAALYFADVLGPILKPVIDAAEAAMAGLIKRLIGLGAAIKAAVSGDNPFAAYNKSLEEFDNKATTAISNVTQGQQQLTQATQQAQQETGKQATQLTGVAAKYKDILKDLNAQLAISGLTSDEYQIQNQLLTIKKQLEGQASAGQLKAIENIIRETEARKLTAKVMEDVARSNTQAMMEAQRLTIMDLNARAEQEAVDQRRLELKRALTREEEAQVRRAADLTRQNRETLAIEQARRQVLGEMTKIEAVQRGVGVQQKLDPMSSAGREYQMDMNALRAHLDAKLINEEQYQRQVTQLKRNYADQQNQLYISQVETEKRQRQTAIEAEQMRLGKTQEQAKTYAEFSMKTEEQKAQFALEAGAQMFSALGAQNKKAFEAAKAFNIANAVMNTYMAATKALASYPPPFNFLAMGAAIAVGMAQVAQIRSQQYSGRALGGPVMGGKTYMVGENGPELFTPNTTGSITRNGDLGGGSVNVTFNIVANDTAGFDDLLLSRRGLIRSVISDAMLESGRRG